MECVSSFTLFSVFAQIELEFCRVSSVRNKEKLTLDKLHRPDTNSVSYRGFKFGKLPLTEATE